MFPNTRRQLGTALLGWLIIDIIPSPIIYGFIRRLAELTTVAKRSGGISTILRNRSVGCFQ